MRHALRVVVAMFLAASALGWSQQPNNEQRQSIRSELDKRLSAVERELVPAVEAMPEDKFTFVPASGEYKGVRNFAQQAKHVAASNFFYFAGFAAEKPPSSAGNLVRDVFLASDENGPANLTSKVDITAFVRDSFAYAHRAVQTITDDNALQTVNGEFGRGTRIGLTVGAIAHIMDHYGQIVEYLRLNGIIPPASRH